MKIDGQLPFLEKSYNEFKMSNNRHSVEKILFQSDVKTTIQILYDTGLFDTFPNEDKVLKDFLSIIKRRPDLEEVNDVIH